MPLKREYYLSSIKDFLYENSDNILGKLLINNTFKTVDLQKNSWKEEIKILKAQLQEFQEGEIAFEYTIPRIGRRIDVVCIIKGVIFLLEFKSGEKEYHKSTDDQVMDYALDLKYFHEMSRDRYIIPINISTEAPPVQNRLSLMDDKIAGVFRCNKNTISNCFKLVLSQYNDAPLNIHDWSASRYSPTPTIIEAAQVLYRHHSVSEISRNDAGVQNLTRTTEAIYKIIDSCKNNHKKAICFVSGVPGAGKTLTGLNIANGRHHFNKDEPAVFLSGNGPLVDVLQEALARDKKIRDHVGLEEARMQTKSFIQNIHNFRDEALTSDKPPKEKVAIFDEAQRAWDSHELSKFMKRQGNNPDFDQSEPEFLIDFMDRHRDWAVIVCLIGDGQEIYSGEAGIENWFHVLNIKFKNWDVYLSNKMTDSEYMNDEETMQNLLNSSNFHLVPELHLDVSLRSFRSEKLSAFVKAVLDNDRINAAKIYDELKLTYPIVITRDFDEAKHWVKTKSRGTERYGLLASSGGKRLRALGIWVPTKIDHVTWFLGGKDNINSSYCLEVAASEFKVQGLEIDYSLVAWDADFRYDHGKFDYFNYLGTRWNHINLEKRQRYLKNAYRVLLTRARQGMVIFVPKGDPEDASRKVEFYDETYRYLKSIGIQEI